MKSDGRIDLCRSPDRDTEAHRRRRLPTGEWSAEWSSEEPTVADLVIPMDDLPSLEGPR